MTASEKAKARKKLPSTANNWYVNWLDQHSPVVFVIKENSINQISLIGLVISWRNKFLLANILFFGFINLRSPEFSKLSDISTGSCFDFLIDNRLIDGFLLDLNDYARCEQGGWTYRNDMMWCDVMWCDVMWLNQIVFQFFLCWLPLFLSDGEWFLMSRSLPTSLTIGSL